MAGLAVIGAFVVSAFLFGFMPGTPSARRLPLSPSEANLVATLYAAGLQRDTSKVGLAIQALDWMHPTVRRVAAITLGRIGSEKAVPALERALVSIPQCQPGMPRSISTVPAADPYKMAGVEKSRRTNPRLHRAQVGPAVRVAIARIKSSRSKGIWRLVAFDVALTLGSDDLASDRFHADRALMDALAEILAEENARGHHVAWAASLLRIGAGQRLRVALAPDTPRSRITKMVDLIAAHSVCSKTTSDLARALVQQGPAASPVIAQHLRERLASGNVTAGDGMLAWVLGAVGDKNERPLLAELESSRNLTVRHCAGQALRSIDAGGQFHSPVCAFDW